MILRSCESNQQYVIVQSNLKFIIDYCYFIRYKHVNPWRIAHKGVLVIEKTSIVVKEEKGFCIVSKEKGDLEFDDFLHKPTVNYKKGV